MKMYKTTADDGTEPRVIEFSTTQAAAASVRKKHVDDGFRRAEVKTVEVEVPTIKADLCQFINDIYAEHRG